MSASSKKKLRKEQSAALLTEKQKQEQKEARKLKAISVSFVAIMLVIALTAATILAVRGVNNSGVIERNTIAAVIDGKELNSIQMNYYFNDYVRNLYSQWSNAWGTSAPVYIGYMGIDINKPLNKQIYDEKTGQTWADFYLEEALKLAKRDYALYNKAVAEGFKLPEDQQKALDGNLSQLDLYAMFAGHKNANQYLKALYGYGAEVESFTEYSTISAIADAYYNAYSESLTYDDAAIREYEKDKKVNYTSFTYAVYTVNANSYLTGGTKDDKGVTTYSDAEKEAAVKAAEEVANNLAKSADLAELDKAIAALDINKDNKNAATTKNTSVLYTGIPSALQSWLADEKRTENEMGVVAIETTSTDSEGKETKTTTGYYVVVFQSRNENLRPLANVRHLLVKFEGGKTGSDGNKIYSETEKAAAKAEAERLLQVWKDGAATEESFIALVKEHSDDGSAEDGGLFEDIHPQSSYVTTFRDWSVDPDRKVGDTAVIVSEYGYHVMYYSSDDELTYRDYMISEDLRAADVEKWFNSINDAATATLGKTNRLNLDLVFAYL